MTKKTLKRLQPHQAEYLGIEVKPNEKNRNGARYYLDKEQLKSLIDLQADYQKNTPLSIKGKSTLKDADGNIVLEWTKTDRTETDRLEALKVAIDTLKEDITPIEPTVKPKKVKGSKLCNQYTLTDYHLGMMAWHEETGDDWDMEIAEKTLINFFKQGIEQSPKANEAIFAQIGDFLHWDGMDAVTPASKHVLDADTRFTKLVRVAIRVIRKIIKMLLNKYQKVTVIMAEGNHDPASSIWLREILSSFYENEKRLVIDTNADPYYCVTFGKNCLFYHHGHKRRLKNIDSAFVGKFKKEFGSADFVYGHTGHLHHEHKVETNLMVIEQHRTLAAKDAYASRGGYLSGRDAKVITYHKDYGEVSRNTININILN